jgi:hypothetical protein
MPDYLDEIRESARIKAERRWGNYELTKKLQAEKAKPKQAMPKKELVLTTDAQRAEAITKFESQFIKDMREMLEGHKKRNQLMYYLHLQRQRKRLLFEKLKRLREIEAQQGQGGSQ